MTALEWFFSILLLISTFLTLAVCLNDEINIRWIKKVHKSVFPILTILCLVTFIYLYDNRSQNDVIDESYSYDNDTSYEEDYSDDYSADSVDDEVTEYNEEIEKEEVTLYEGTHMGGYDVIPGSYLAIANSTDSGNLFVYDSWGDLAYSQFYGSSDDENREGVPVYIEDAGEIKITGISSITFEPIGN